MTYHEQTPTPAEFRRALEAMVSKYFATYIAREQFLAAYDRMIAQAENAADKETPMTDQKSHTPNVVEVADLKASDRGGSGIESTQAKELSMYRVKAAIGNQNKLLYCIGWSKRDVQEKLKIRMRSEGHTLDTLSFLDRRPLTMTDQKPHTPTTRGVRSVYLRMWNSTRWPGYSLANAETVAAEFDRWLATVEAAAEQRGAVKALRDAAKDVRGYELSAPDDWLYERADQIADQEGDDDATY